MDKISKEKRSANMAKIKSRDTIPERFIRCELHKRNLRFRVNFSEIRGKPDLYFSKNRTAVFVNGCFWHRHADCSNATTPKNNAEFWQKKFSDNICRDQALKKELRDSGYRMLIIWECTIKKMMKNQQYCEEMLDVIIGFIKSSDFDYLEV